jgi:hypothetical protein
VRGSNWHIIAECRAEGLKEARVKGTIAVEEAIGNIECNDALQRKWHRRLETSPEGNWIGRDEEGKSGMKEIPWFGVWGEKWLDEWVEDRGGKVCGDDWDRGVRAIRKLQEVCVEACHTVWKAACDIWFGREQDGGPRERRLTREKAESMRAKVKQNKRSLLGVEVEAAEQWAGRIVEEIEAGKEVRGLARAAPGWRRWGPDQLVDWYRRVKKQRLKEAEKKLKEKGKKGKGKEGKGSRSKGRWRGAEEGRKGGVEHSIMRWIRKVERGERKVQETESERRQGRGSREEEEGVEEWKGDEGDRGSRSADELVEQMAPSRLDRPPEYTNQ